jgi:hypothetical protein
MTGTTLDYKKHCRLPFGAYVETHEVNKPSNTLKERTRAAICLGPTANFQGSYEFLCPCTGRRITRKQFQELPMPASFISAVEALADRDKQAGTMDFTDRDSNTYDNLDDTNQPINGVVGVDIGGEAPHDEQEQEEENDNDPPDSNGETPSIMIETPGVPETAEMEPEDTGVGLGPEGMEPPEMEPEDTGVGLEIPGVAEESPIPGVPIELPGVLSELPGVLSEEGGDNSQPTQNPDADDDSNGPPPPLSPRSEDTSDNADSDDEDEDDEHDEEIPDDEVYHPDTMIPSVQSTYGLRNKRARDYSHLQANIVHHAMTQYSLNRGLRKFREKGEKSVEKELGQLHMKKNLLSRTGRRPLVNTKKGALESLVFLKEKRDGSIKRRA